MCEGRIERVVIAVVLALPLMAVSGVAAPPPGQTTLAVKATHPADPSIEGIVFDTEFEEYALGDVVRHFILNLGDRAIGLPCTASFSVQRFVDSDWRLVGYHVCLMVIVVLEPGEGREWSWKAESATDHPELARVEPGLYRVGGFGCVDRESVSVAAYFWIR